MCNCISPIALRILSFKASIVSSLSETPQIIFQRCQIAAPRWPNDISSAADNAIFKDRPQNIEYSFGCVAHSAVLLKPNVVNILLFNFCEQKFFQHGPITIAIDWNVLSLLIMRSLKIGRKTSSIASAVWHIAPSCWNQMLPIFFFSTFVNKNSFNMAR